jgi:hypothetical protein
MSSGGVVGAEISINVKEGGKVTIKAWSGSDTHYLVPLVIQAISFVLSTE